MLGSCFYLNELQVESYKEVLGVDIRVLWEVVVLLGHEYTLLEEVLVDLLSVSLWDKPAMSWLADARVACCLGVHTLSRVPGALRGIVYDADVVCKVLWL